MTLQTTLNAIRAHFPCGSGWTKLLAHLGKTKADDDPLEFETILDSNFEDALWCLRALDHTHQRTCRLYAVWCARQVQHLITDKRSIDALDVAERYANGDATDMELDIAWAASDALAASAASDSSASWAAAAAASAAASAAGASRDAQIEKFRQICRAGEWVA